MELILQALPTRRSARSSTRAPTARHAEVDLRHPQHDRPEGADIIVGFPDAGAASCRRSTGGHRRKGSRRPVRLGPRRRTPARTTRRRRRGPLCCSASTSPVSSTRRSRPARSFSSAVLRATRSRQGGRTARSRRSLRVSSSSATADTILDPAGQRWQAMSGFLSKYPDLTGSATSTPTASSAASDAYQTAKKRQTSSLTIRTDETGLFCEWKKLNNPNFKIYYSYGRNFQSRVALTAAMMKLNGSNVPGQGELSARTRAGHERRLQHDASRRRLRHRPSCRTSAGTMYSQDRTR